MAGATLFAVIASGGRQYRVVPGDLVRVDRLPQPKGDAVTFDHVLLVGDGGTVRVGAPYVSGAAVKGSVVDQRRDAKIIVFRRRRTKQYKKTRGHRQHYTLVRIDTIDA